MTKEFNNLVNIVKVLRSKKGCHWDRAQKLSNLKTYFLEEVYELLDAMDSGSYKKTEEELGDVLLILIFMCQLYKEKKKFTIKEVIEGISNKLITRHPHVFSPHFKENKKLNNKEAIVKYWIKQKAKNKKRKNVLDRLPKGAPSLLLAYILFKEENCLSRKPTAKQIIFKLREETGKLKAGNNKEAIVEAIFDLARLSSLYKIDLEYLLRKKIRKYAAAIKY